MEKSGAVKALRCKEPWRNVTGDNLIFHLMVELIEAKKKIKAALRKMDSTYPTDKRTLTYILKGEE